MVLALLFAKLVSIRGIAFVAGVVLLGAGLIMSGAPVLEPIAEPAQNYVDGVLDWLAAQLGDRFAPW